MANQVGRKIAMYGVGIRTCQKGIIHQTTCTELEAVRGKSGEKKIATYGVGIRTCQKGIIH